MHEAWIEINGRLRWRKNLAVADVFELCCTRGKKSTLKLVFIYSFSTFTSRMTKVNNVLNVWGKLSQLLLRAISNLFGIKLWNSSRKRDLFPISTKSTKYASRSLWCLISSPPLFQNVQKPSEKMRARVCFTSLSLRANTWSSTCSKRKTESHLRAESTQSRLFSVA